MRGTVWRVSVFRDSLRFESTDFGSFEVSKGQRSVNWEPAPEVPPPNSSDVLTRFLQA